MDLRCDLLWLLLCWLCIHKSSNRHGCFFTVSLHPSSNRTCQTSLKKHGYCCSLTRHWVSCWILSILQMSYWYLLSCLKVEVSPVYVMSFVFGLSRVNWFNWWTSIDLLHSQVLFNHLSLHFWSIPAPVQIRNLRLASLIILKLACSPGNA